MSWENLIKDQSIFSSVIILLILITLPLDCLLISSGESWCWSLVGLKGLILADSLNYFRKGDSVSWEHTKMLYFDFRLKKPLKLILSTLN